jgi:hypothetical protein
VQILTSGHACIQSPQVVPLAVLVSEERRVVSTALAFGIQAALLCGLVACLSALLAVHLGATVPQWLDSTYGFMLVRVVVHPALMSSNLEL